MAARRINRVKTLKKKTSELATLCGIHAVLIIYEHDGPTHYSTLGPKALNKSAVAKVWISSQRYQDCKGLDLLPHQPGEQRKISEVNLDSDQAEMITNATQKATKFYTRDWDV